MHKIKGENPVNIRYDRLLRSKTIEKKRYRRLRKSKAHIAMIGSPNKCTGNSSRFNVAKSYNVKKGKRGSSKIDSPYAGSFPHFYLQNTIAHMCFTSRTPDNLLVRSLLIFLCLALPALFLCAEEYSLYISWQMATAFAAFDFFRRSLVDIYASPYCRYR